MSMSKIQSELKAPKGQFNSFGKYKYRSCEDIVEAVKPILAQYNYHLTMSDDVIGVGDRVYIKATCCVMDGEKVVSMATALAREALDKKGMDDSQITGTASSYARKYALNGLFAIDDTKDADSDEHEHQKAKDSKPKQSPAPNLVPPPLSAEELSLCVKNIATIDDMATLKGVFGSAYKRANDLQKEALTAAYNLQKSKLEKAA